MSLYPGYKGRAVLIGSDGSSYNLYLTKCMIATKTQEEDVTAATPLAAFACRSFVAATIPQVNVSLEGFWSKTNNPFGATTPLLVGFNYIFKVYFDKSGIANVNTSLLITGCEIQTSVRDVVRYVVAGVFNAPIVPSSADGFPRFIPLN